MKLSNSRFVLAAALLASALCAQPLTKSASYTRSYGPSSPRANLNIDLQAMASRTTTSTSAHAHARATVNILTWSARALSIDANASSTATAATGSLKIVVAGYTMVNESRSGLYTWSHKFGPYNLFAQDPEIPVPFTLGLVTVGVNVGGGAEVTVVTSGNATTRSLSLGGSGRVYGTGHARIVLGLGGYGVIAQFDLRFLDTTVAPYLSASMTNMSGALNLSMTPLAIVLKVLLKLPLIGTVMSKQVWNWSSSALETSLKAS